MVGKSEGKGIYLECACFDEMITLRGSYEWLDRGCGGGGTEFISRRIGTNGELL